MRLFELDLLLEDRIGFLATQYAGKLTTAVETDLGETKEPVQVVQELLAADPSNGKYLQWIVNRYTAGEFKLEDVSRLRDDLSEFTRIRPILQNKDINQFKSLKDLYDELEKHESEEVKSGKQLKKEEAAEFFSSRHAELVYSGPEGMLVVPKTEEAAKFFGKGTKWCTSAENNNQFEEYSSRGKLYIWIDKQLGTKFQFHIETQQFMNDLDLDIGATSIKHLIQVKPLLPFLAKFPSLLLAHFRYDALVEKGIQLDTSLVKRHEWPKILFHQPKMAKYCDWDKLSGTDWASLLDVRPEFAEHCNWNKLNGADWVRLLSMRPEFAEHCDWSELSGLEWGQLLRIRPQFDKYRTKTVD